MRFITKNVYMPSAPVYEYWSPDQEAGTARLPKGMPPLKLSDKQVDELFEKLGMQRTSPQPKESTQLQLSDEQVDELFKKLGMQRTSPLPR